MNRSDKTNKIIKICMFLAVATCSFDIFANVTFLGFNFRFCQFILSGNIPDDTKNRKE